MWIRVGTLLLLFSSSISSPHSFSASLFKHVCHSSLVFELNMQDTTGPSLHPSPSSVCLFLSLILMIYSNSSPLRPPPPPPLPLPARRSTNTKSSHNASTLPPATPYIYTSLPPSLPPSLPRLSRARWTRPLFLELGGEPVEAFHQPVSRGGTRGLDVPMPALGGLREGGREGGRETAEVVLVSGGKQDTWN